jgi:hypothetical protein
VTPSYIASLANNTLTTYLEISKSSQPPNSVTLVSQSVEQRGSYESSLSKAAVRFICSSNVSRLGIQLLLVLDISYAPLLQIVPINLHAPKLGLNLPDPILFLMGCSIAKCYIHILQSLEIQR